MENELTDCQIDIVERLRRWQANWPLVDEAADEIERLRGLANITTITCKQCGLIFTAGQGTGRRKTSKFCSHICQDAWWNDVLKTRVYWRKRRDRHR
jgi:hypothetical protein